MASAEDARTAEQPKRVLGVRSRSLAALAPEPMAVTRKKALLRILCLAEAERSGVTPSRTELAEFRDSFRRAFAIHDESRLEDWLESNGLERAEFDRMLFELCVQALIEERMVPHVDRELSSQRAIWTLHAWAQAQGGR